MSMDPRPLKQRLMTRLGSLEAERSSWTTHWQECSDFILPRAGRFETSDRNLGEKRHTEIYDSTATRALRVEAAGMMAGATSPARPWFRLALADPDLNRYQPVKQWLDEVTKLMQRVFQRSNVYRTLHSMYEELGAFGTAACIIQPDFDNVIHLHSVTIGEYCLSTSSRGEVDTIYRKFDMTVAQLVGEFGLDAVSRGVRSRYEGGNLDSWVTVVQAIEPRGARERYSGKLDNLNMPWRSCYFEVGGDEQLLLRESGYERFPVLAPRWSVSGGDIYGNGPGMEALGDIRALQLLQLRKAQAIDYQTQPPLQAPTSMQSAEVNMLPGGVTFVDAANPQAGIRPAWETRLELSPMLMDIAEHQRRINSAFYSDMFLMLASAGPQTRMTATEVAERHEEKLLMLGPVLERLHNELLRPLIDNTFDHMAKVGMLPAMPEQIAGMDIQPEFVSMLAQAQRAIGTNAVDRFLGHVAGVAQYKPEVLDKIDTDYLVDSYGDMLGVDPHAILATEDVADIRRARNEAMAAKEQQAMAAQQAQAARNLAAVPTGPGANNAANDLMSQFSGYSSPPPQAY
jgi:hypothetical protein